MLIGSFEIGVALLVMMILFLVAPFSVGSVALFVFLLIYGAIGAGLLAIQEWARRANVILHLVAVPFTFYTVFFLGGGPGWQPAVQVFISVAIIVALTRPAIEHKFGTVVSKQKNS
jgi:uncharacterized membrane protein (DUF2068 family)